MEHIAIDLGGRLSQICVRSETGEILHERKHPTVGLGEFFEKRAKSRVVLETCAEAFAVADKALGCGHEARVVPATLVRSLGVGSRGVKTDRRDARILSEVSTRIDLPSVHIPTKTARERKARTGMREALVGARTQLINTVRGWLRAEAIRVRSGVEALPRRVREWAEERGTELPSYVERQLETIESLTEQIKKADDELREEAEREPTCQRLMSVPGVGPVTAIRFVAALDDVTRFASAHKVEAYLGLVPGEYSSSDKQRRTGITKAGPAALRRTLVQAAWSARRAHGTHPMVLWSMEVERRRGKRIAVVALARKLAGMLYAIWRDGTRYEPGRSAQMA